MLVNAAQMLKDAEAGHYALGAFNTNNLRLPFRVWTMGGPICSSMQLRC